MFKYLIIVKPLGLMYGSAGAFLSPENLVGRSGSKFPPEAATLSGLFFSVNKINPQCLQAELRQKLFTAGPFWTKSEDPQKIYVPIPWTKIIAKKGYAEWKLDHQNGQYFWAKQKSSNIPADEDLEPDYSWFPIDDWEKKLQVIESSKSAQSSPWKYTTILHPKMETEERSVLPKNGLFLENGVQMQEDTSLVYLSSHPLEEGWYKFGGENHLVEIKSQEINPKKPLYELLQQKIQRSFALITPAVWGSNRFSHRYPQHPDFPKVIQMLTDKPIPYRYSAGGRLGRGRYAVPSGSVYVLEKPLNLSWWEWCEEWFPKEGYHLKRVGCGLCLPIDIKGLSSEEKA